MITAANPRTGKSHWRVFYTFANFEKKCEQVLLNKHIEVFLPRYTRTSQWKDRKKKIESPLFQNYIFACVDEGERLKVLQTKGIVRCVCFGGKPAILQPEEISQLKLLQHLPELIQPEPVWRPVIGQVIEVKEGPFYGLKGIATDFRGHTMVVVNIPSIKQSVRVILPANNLTVLA